MKTCNLMAAWRGLSKCDKCGMRHLALFSDLDPEDLQHNPLPIDDLHFNAGTVLYREGEDGISVFTIRSGLVKLVQHLPNGSHRIVRLLRPGNVAGLETLLGDPYQHTAITLQSTMVCRIPCETVHRLNAETPRLHRQIMVRFKDSVRQADEWLTNLSTGSAKARMARLFLYLQEDPCNPVCELFNRDDVAAMLGLTTETASRIVADMRRTGLITQLHRNTFHFDAERLTDLAVN